MNAAAMSRVLSLIPERNVRALSGTLFTDDEAARAQHADRVQYVARFLSWLTPLNPISKEHQRFLGLLATHARPDQADDESGEELEAGADALDEEAAEEPVYDEVPAPRPSGLSLASPSGPLVSGAIHETG